MVSQAEDKLTMLPGVIYVVKTSCNKTWKTRPVLCYSLQTIPGHFLSIYCTEINPTKSALGDLCWLPSYLILS